MNFLKFRDETLFLLLFLKKYYYYIATSATPLQQILDGKLILILI